MTARDESGQPVPDGTVLAASTTLGRLKEGAALSHDGIARFKLIAAQEAGTAIVTVAGGGAVARVGVEFVPVGAPSIQVSAGSDAPPFGLTGTMEGRAAAVAVDVTGAAQAEGTGYTARFDGEHLSFTRTGALPAKGENVSFAFALSRVRLGAQAFSFEEPEVGVEENRAFAGRVAGLREEYVFLDTVVKQSFTLSRSLGATAGKDLVIEGVFSAAGLRPIYRSDREGIVFADGTGREVLAYGGALVQDGLGRQVLAHLMLEGEQVSIVVPGAWLAEAAYPVVVDPVIGDPVLVADWGTFNPVVAYNPDDDEWLVAWRSGSNEIEGQRVRPDGTLAGDAFYIVITDSQKSGLSVAYNPDADGYLVTWHDGRVSGEWHVYGQRVAANGTVVGSEIAIDTTSYYQLWPSVAYQAATDEWLVVWNSYTGATWDVLGQRISSSGALVGGSFAITEEDYPDGRPHVVANPEAGEYLAVWHVHTDEMEYSLRARRVLTDGTTLGDEIVLASVDDESPWPRVAFNPDDEEYLVVWQDDRNGNWDVYGQRVSITGTLVGGNFGVTTASGDQVYPRVAWDGRSGRHLVVWETEDETIEGQQMWGDGTLDGEKSTLAAYGWSPEVAYGSESGIFLSVYEADSCVYAQRYGIPVADFSAAPLSGSAPLTVTFSNLSYPLYGTTAYTWTFGDGATSTLTDPAHAYTTPGVYSVTLTTAVATDTHTLTRTNYISVSGEGGGPITVTRTITYTYDPLGRLTDADYSTGESYEYAYDEVGNRTAYTVTLESTTVTTYTYDAANRLTAVGDVAYTWDERGNLTSDGVFTYTYNAAGRLVEAESVTSTLVYTYTAGGLRVAQSVDGDTSTFAWDWASGLPEMLSEGGNLYLVGHETLGKWDGDEWTYYLPDGLGSVRQEVDENGAVVAAREWTPYGVEVGTAQAGLGYTGEWQDAYRDIGLTYLRARWYRPEDARFLSPDPIIPDYRNPQSINRFAYVRGNPTNWIDPTGLNGVEAGNLEYSCRCGWIDWTHAWPKAAWDIIQKVRVHPRSDALHLENWIAYAGPPNHTLIDFDLGDVGLVFPTYRYHWVVKEGLTAQQDLEIAWAIFREASLQYEAWQGVYGEIIPGPVGDILRTSVLHEEDLPSNGIGFYMASWMEQRDIDYYGDLRGDWELWGEFKNEVRRLCESAGYIEGDSPAENEERIKQSSRSIAERYPWIKWYHFEGRTDAPLPCGYCSTSCRTWPNELSRVSSAPMGVNWKPLSGDYNTALTGAAEIADGVYAFWPDHTGWRSLYYQ